MSILQRVPALSAVLGTLILPKEQGSNIGVITYFRGDGNPIFSVDHSSGEP